MHIELIMYVNVRSVAFTACMNGLGKMGIICKINFINGYHRQGKICWDKYLQFQCHLFHRNICFLDHKCSLFGTIKEALTFTEKISRYSWNCEKRERLAHQIFPCLRYINGSTSFHTDKVAISNPFQTTGFWVSITPSHLRLLIGLSFLLQCSIGPHNCFFSS